MAQRKSLLEEIREQNGGANLNQGVVSSARKTYDDGQPSQSQQQGQRTSLLQEIIDSDGMGSLNKDYVDKALGFDGGFGALAGGYIPGDDGQVYMRNYKSEAEVLRERLAQTAAAKTEMDQQEESPENLSFWDRIKNFFTRDRAKDIGEAALTGTGAGYTGAMRVLYEAGQGGRDRENREQLAEWETALERAQRDYEYLLEEAGGDTENGDVISQGYIIEDLQRKVDAMRKVVGENVQQQATQATTELTHELEEKSAAATERAKAGTGKIGRIAVDATINMLQMGGDAIAAVATGGNSLMPMAFRVLGQGASEAQQAGAGVGRQLAFATTAAGIEVFTEKLFDGVAGLYGKGAADEITEAVVKKLARTDAGRTALRIFLGMNEEGLEEVISNILSPAAQTIYNGQSLGQSYKENFSVSDMLYDYLIGAVAAGGMNAVNIANPIPGQNTIAQNRQANAELREQEQAAAPAQETTTPAQPVDTGMQLIQQVITNMDVPEAAQQILLDGYNTGDADAQTYALGIREAVMLGQQGQSYEQALDNSAYADKLNQEQFRHAWQIGAQKAGNSTEAKTQGRAVSTPEYESIEDFSQEFKQPEAVKSIFRGTEGADVNEFAAGFRAAYDMGQSGVSSSYLTETNVPTLTKAQAEAAYELGRQDAATLAQQRSDTVTGKQKTGGNLRRAKGSVKGEGVNLAQLRTAFNDRQNTAYRLLTRYADTTGVNIVLYNSEANPETGIFPAAQGRFQWKDDTIYIDINSGLYSTKDVNSLGQYTMLRTFAHEFTHFIEKWNPKEYNEFREFVFQTLENKGENVHDLIEAKQALDDSGNMSYEQASREVVADAMMDILPDSQLVQQLATEHQSIFRQLLKKLREFAARMKQYYREISTKAPREAEALKENNAYLSDIVEMWDRIAKGAVESYQGANGDILVDQPEKPANLPKRPSQTQVKSKSNPSPETRRAGMEFFKPVDAAE